MREKNQDSQKQDEVINSQKDNFKMNNKINVAVLGSTGYVGMELVELLSRHENVKIVFLGSDSVKGEYLKNIENTKEHSSLPKLKHNDLFDPQTSDYVFLALPHSVSNKFVKRFYGKIKIIDLSADFRLDDIKVYNKIYGKNHCCSEYLKDFVYGLAEINKNKISQAQNISVPGCYPT